LQRVVRESIFAALSDRIFLRPLQWRDFERAIAISAPTRAEFSLSLSRVPWSVVGGYEPQKRALRLVLEQWTKEVDARDRVSGLGIEPPSGYFEYTTN
jgi:hypothetical protein